MFWGVFCLFRWDFQGSQGRKILDVFEGFPGFFKRTKEKKDRVIHGSALHSLAPP